MELHSLLIFPPQKMENKAGRVVENLGEQAKAKQTMQHIVKSLGEEKKEKQ